MKGIRPLNEFIQLYRDHLISAGNSCDPLRTCLHDVLEFHDDIGEEKDLRKVDRRQATRYLANIRRKYEVNAAQRKEKAVRAFYEFLHQEKLVGSNPFEDSSSRQIGGRHG